MPKAGRSCSRGAGRRSSTGRARTRRFLRARSRNLAPVARIAIVTGSDSGIGKATAVALARDGFDVGITWHADDSGADQTASEVRAAGRRAEVRRLDLIDLPSAADVIDDLADTLGGVD